MIKEVVIAKIEDSINKVLCKKWSLIFQDQVDFFVIVQDAQPKILQRLEHWLLLSLVRFKNLIAKESQVVIKRSITQCKM